MKLEEKNGLRILYPDYGYWIKNKETGDIYTGKIYLSKFASIDIYEEVRNETIDDALFVLTCNSFPTGLRLES